LNKTPPYNNHHHHNNRGRYNHHKWETVKLWEKQINQEKKASNKTKSCLRNRIYFAALKSWRKKAVKEIFAVC
jgi:hypothetical protein